MTTNDPHTLRRQHAGVLSDNMWMAHARLTDAAAPAGQEHNMTPAVNTPLALVTSLHGWRAA